MAIGWSRLNWVGLLNLLVFLNTAPTLAQEVHSQAELPAEREIPALFEALDDMDSADRLKAATDLSFWFSKKAHLLSEQEKTLVASQLVQFIETESTRSWDPSPGPILVAYTLLGEMGRFGDILNLVEKFSEPGYGRAKRSAVQNALTVNAADYLPVFVETPSTRDELDWNAGVEVVLLRVLGTSVSKKSPKVKYLHPDFVRGYLDRIKSGFCRIPNGIVGPVCLVEMGSPVSSLRLSPKVSKALVGVLAEAYSEDIPLFESLVSVILLGEDPKVTGDALEVLSRIPRLNPSGPNFGNSYVVSKLKYKLDRSSNLEDLVSWFLDVQMDRTATPERAQSSLLNLLDRLIAAEAYVLAESGTQPIDQELKSKYLRAAEILFFKVQHSPFRKDGFTSEIFFILSRKFLTPEQTKRLLIDPIVEDVGLVLAHSRALAYVIRDPALRLNNESLPSELIQALLNAAVDQSKPTRKLHSIAEGITEILAAEIDAATEINIANLKPHIRDVVADAQALNFKPWPFIQKVLAKSKNQEAEWIELKNSLAFDYYQNNARPKSVKELRVLLELLAPPIEPEMLSELGKNFVDMTRNSAGSSPDSEFVRAKLGLPKKY